MPTPEELLPRLEVLRNKAVVARNELRRLYANLPNDDPRIVVARHIKAVFSSSYLNLIHVHENLQERAWWRRQGFGNALRNGNIPDELEDYMTLLAIGLVVFPLSLFEAGPRRILTAFPLRPLTVT